MKAQEVRSAFLEFFAERKHEVVASSPLVPANDPTLLFTNAGMVQFKDVFTGKERRSYVRATSSQKCLRAGGKHNDLHAVGRTARHLTFFEMLGNFSFGDYFKQDAISWAWELLVQILRVDPSRLLITVFEGDAELGVAPDDDARAIWKKVTGWSDDRILGMPKEENFWMMGETGPMGPCSEIHFHYGDHLPCSEPVCRGTACDCDRWVELWNLVFMQYERKTPGGTLHKLPAPSIDTGAGLERMTTVLEGKLSNYDTDVFTPLLQEVSDICGKPYGANPDSDVSMRVIADHARATSFLIAEGVFPDKNGREYVARRIFRRAVRHGKLLGIDSLFMPRVCQAVVDQMGDVFPELRERQSVIERIASGEEERFRNTMDRGMNLLEEEFARMQAQGERVLSGDRVFQLYDTFGFPEDLTELIAEERGFEIDVAGFQRRRDETREESKLHLPDVQAVADVYKQMGNELPPTEFLGYQGTTGEGRVGAIVVKGARVDRAGAGESVAFVVDRTPFYAESGGQVGDAGDAEGDGVAVRVTDCTQLAGGLYVHHGEVTRGTLAVGQELALRVDAERRERIRANHSATHLLHHALKRVLGDHVAQKGSLVAPDRLRFDYSHFQPMTDDEKKAVEDWLNGQIRANIGSKVETLPIDEAKERGAVAMFGETYGERVRVVGIGAESLEFCGGTHVSRTGDIGLFKIVSEAGIAQGVRRIEAVTGAGSLSYLRDVERIVQVLSEQLKVVPAEVPTRVDKLQKRLKQLQKDVGELRAKLAGGAGGRDLMAKVRDVGGVKLLAATTEVADPKALREVGDQLRDRLGSGIVVLAGVDGNRVSLVAMVSKDLTERFHAGKLLEAAAEEVDGRGGGRPDMAQGGGKDASKVDRALARVAELVGAAA